MKLPDGTTLMHDALHAYDPAKAHDYYLRTRKLKGRKTGVAEVARKPREVGQPVVAKPKRSTQKQLNDIKRKLEVLKSRRASGDVQKRTAAEKATQAKDLADKKSAAAKEVAAVRKELGTLKKSITKKMEDKDKAPILEQITKVEERLTAALEAAQSLSG